MTALVWFRRDLRIADNPALAAATASKKPVVAVYILSPSSDWPIGSASRVWLHHSLRNLRESLLNLGINLVFKKGAPSEVLSELANIVDASELHWNREYDPAGIADAAQVKKDLQETVSCHSYNARLLIEPFKFSNKSGEPYRVYTPFWKELFRTLQHTTGDTISPSWKQQPFVVPPTELDELALLSGHPWEQKIVDHWRIGESAAWETCDVFIDGMIENYDDRRNFPAQAATSKLSPYYHFGEISVQKVWQRLLDGMEAVEFPGAEEAVLAWLRQLAWREFSHHLLYHFPHSASKPLNEKFANMEWLQDDELLTRWQRGQTGYPLVDAGMRELWATGWMHNRVRMVVASFLTKHLGIHWLEGARWFWDTLVDADLANNTMGWQWIAGSGADASPYYRIFNPTMQSQKFDATGEYIRRWVPELSALGNKAIHEPTAVKSDLPKNSYPDPCVDHALARQAALARYQEIKT
ncbi:MAG: cryptochrome/photolyase family protein [Gammaproteobacteria bacterium]